MSKTVEQIYATNPTTVVADTDLYYLVQSPYTPGADAAISGASLKAAFGGGGTINAGTINQIAYYADAGTTLSGTSTIPSAVQDNITRLGTISSIGAPLGGAFGGTGVNNGTSTITIGGNFAMSGAFGFTGTLTGLTSVTFPTSGTLATTSQLLASPLTTKGDIWVWSTTNDRLPVGVTNGQFLQVNSSAATGLSWSSATIPSTATNAARILRSDGTNWVQTTSTFADTYTASSILYANGANNIAGLTTANNGLLVTNNTGVPSILAGPGTTGNMVISNASAAPSFTTFTYPTTVGANGSIHISNGANIVSSTSLWPNTVGTSRKVVISDGTSNVYSTEKYAVPGASGNVMTSDGTNWTSAAPASAAGRLLNIQVFTASGSNTYTPTAGTNKALVRLWGAGGGGGSTTSATTGGGGGGGGAYAESFVSVSGSVTISIGAGGAGRAANQTTGTGTSGGNTTYNTTTVVAAGGTGGGCGALGGSGGAGGTVASSTGTIKLAGATGGTTGSTWVIGIGGSSPGIGTTGPTGLFGQSPPANSGAGGGGGTSATAGGTSGDGLAIVYEFS